MAHTSRVAVALIAAVVLLSGCIRIESHMTFYEDETMSQTLEMAYDRDQISDLGDPDEFLAEMAAGLVDIEDLYASVGLEDSEVGLIDTADEVGMYMDVERAPLDVLEDPRLYESLGGSPNESLVITFADGEYRLLIPGEDLQRSADEEGMDLALFALIIDADMTYTFPGPVLEASAGTIDGNSVRLTSSDIYSGEDIRIRASAVAGSSGIPAWLFVSLLFVAAIGFGVLMFFLARGRGDQENAAQPFGDAAAPVMAAPAAAGAAAPAAATAKKPAAKPAAKTPAAKKKPSTAKSSGTTSAKKPKGDEK